MRFKYLAIAAVVAAGATTAITAGRSSPVPVKSEAQLQSYLSTAAHLTSLPKGTVPSLSDLPDSFARLESSCIVSPSQTNPIKACVISKCTLGDIKSKRTLVLYGDSHAAMWANALSSIATQDRFRIVVLTVGNCGVADLNMWDHYSVASSKGCTAFRNWVPGYVKGLHPFAILVAFIKDQTIETYAQTPVAPSVFESGLAKSLKHLLTVSPRVLLLGEQPTLPVIRGNVWQRTYMQYRSVV